MFDSIGLTEQDIKDLEILSKFMEYDEDKKIYLYDINRLKENGVEDRLIKEAEAYNKSLLEFADALAKEENQQEEKGKLYLKIKGAYNYELGLNSLACKTIINLARDGAKAIAGFLIGLFPQIASFVGPISNLFINKFDKQLENYTSSGVVISKDSKIIEARWTVKSDPISKTVKSIPYTFWTQASSDVVGAYGSIVAKSSKSIPAGYISGHANLYNGQHKVVKTANWYTNPSSTYNYMNTTPRTTASNRFYTKGTVRLYDGSKYIGYTAYPSPEVSYGYGRGTSISEKEFDERQRLYDMKNMIAAVGVNNIEGYVSIDDLYDTKNEPTSPEEMLERQNKRMMSNETYRLIPLYDNDGETVIGEYRID